MSRSYKRNSVYKPSATRKDKRAASKKVRRCSLYIPVKGKGYKRIFESWDIRDYRMWRSLRDYIRDWPECFESKDEAVQHWKKYYKRK